MRGRGVKLALLMQPSAEGHAQRHAHLVGRIAELLLSQRVRVRHDAVGERLVRSAQPRAGSTGLDESRRRLRRPVAGRSGRGRARAKVRDERNVATRAWACSRLSRRALKRLTAHLAGHWCPIRHQRHFCETKRAASQTAVKDWGGPGDRGWTGWIASLSESRSTRSLLDRLARVHGLRCALRHCLLGWRARSAAVDARRHCPVPHAEAALVVERRRRGASRRQSQA